jgi:hypothetical protein
MRRHFDSRMSRLVKRIADKIIGKFVPNWRHRTICEAAQTVATASSGG